jgi:hypothetical protein
MANINIYKLCFLEKIMKMGNKRGQLTLFIILGVIVVAGIGGYFAVSRVVFDGSSSKFPEVNSLIESCIEEVTLDGIYFNSLQGGYYDVPEPKIDIDFLEVPIYFDKGNIVNVPSKEVLERELEKAVQEVVDLCFDVEDLRERGYDVEVSDSSKVKVRLNNDYVDVEVEKNVVVSQGESSASFSKFSNRVGFDYLGKIEIVEEFLEIQKGNPSEIMFSQMELFGEEKGIQIESFKFGDSLDYSHNFIYSTIKYGERTFVFSFGARYL